jgi:ADP-ribose pyrophosphatase YjhB (NUDIX family)
MKYCSHCGSNRLEWQVPTGDHLPRWVCADCHTIFYQNPKLVVGCIPEWEDKILLCKRAIEPRYGLWTLPAGFMENNETLEQAAIRETWEEAHASLEPLQLYGIFSLPHISQVYVLFRAPLRDLTFQPGMESLEVSLFSQDEIPWENLAFAVIRRVLTHYFQDRANGQFLVHIGEVTPPPKPIEK